MRAPMRRRWVGFLKALGEGVRASCSSPAPKQEHHQTNYDNPPVFISDFMALGVWLICDLR
jgi:hypothetical protein